MHTATDVKGQVLAYALKTYGTVQEWPFPSAPRCSVLRHPVGRKLYALLKEVDRQRLRVPGSGFVDLLGIRCGSALSGSLRMREGILPAWHTRSDAWVSILLDGTVPAEEIFPLLDLSYQQTLPRGVRDPNAPPKYWIVPANLRHYDLAAALRRNPEGIFRWKQSSLVAVGDIVYLYAAAPHSAIRWKCRAVRVDIPYQHQRGTVSMNRVMELQLLECYDPDPIPLEQMRLHGVTTVRGPRYMPDSLREEIERTRHA